MTFMLLANSHHSIIPFEADHVARRLQRRSDEIERWKYRNDKEYLPRHELWRCRTGTDASEGRDLGRGATSCAGALHPAMVTANDDDDDASSAAKGSRVGLWYQQKYAYSIHGKLIATLRFGYVTIDTISSKRR
jgi:hypothetical protein